MEIPMAGAPGAALTPVMKQELDTLVQDNDIVLFMKGTPNQPQCGFSMRAAQVLEQLGHPYHAVDVFARPEPGAFIAALAQWADFPTLPQVWVKGELLGGSDIALDMLQSGELQEMLN